MLNGKLFIIGLMILALYSSCKDGEIFPEVPAIEFKSHYFVRDPNSPLGFGNDTLLGIIFTYRDGDGDIGLLPSDTNPPFERRPDSLGRITNFFHYNIHVQYFEMVNGRMQPFIIPNSTDTFKVAARIGSLTPDGKFKAIRGEIDYRFMPPQFNTRRDSIKVRIQLIDRALNVSNVAESPVIVLP
jgi:hypothetical protein